MHQSHTSTDQIELRAILKRSVSKIAPLWSLENFVAVNPYLGMVDQDFSEAMDFLNKTGQAEATLPISFYLEAFRQGRLTESDINKALERNNFNVASSADKMINTLRANGVDHDDLRVRTLVDVAGEINGKKWHRFMVDRISFWASAYFDKEQAMWKTASGNNSLYLAWKQEAEVDYSTEAMGLKGFRKHIQSLPNNHLEAAAQALAVLDIPESILDYYLTGLLMKMNGWAGFAARIDWDAGLEGRSSQAVEEFLAIMLVWEMSVKELLPYEDLNQTWQQAKNATQTMLLDNRHSERLAHQLVLQEAFDIANQRMIIEKINDQKPVASPKQKTPAVQAIFCIDVRSEVFRRNLEAVDNDIETMGFAGFFAFPIKYVPVAHNEGANQCPVLLTTSHTIKEAMQDFEEEQRAVTNRTVKAHVLKAWKSFKSGAISCFGFVSPLGLYFLPKLLTDAFGLTRPVPHPDDAGLTKKQIKSKGVKLDSEDIDNSITGIPTEDRLRMATSALKAMSLTENFARIVLVTGHGSSTVNNPHATGLDCGACGGHSGEANAKVAAAVLNDPQVREGLKTSGINIPDATLFVAALHDTTTDDVEIFQAGDSIPASHAKDIAELKYALNLAGEKARKERAVRMKISNGDVSKQVIQRSQDWSQVRPEWGLAGCSSFIVAPRERTSALNFGGKAFMHSYAWRKDTDFSVLELIMTAPMVVTSWINLQYYASTVDNKKFGAGNKALHNVVGGMGVLEGFAGDLRTGLAWQSVHDGEQFQHEPQRLNVIIEAPVDEMSKILDKHESIRQLCDNQWIYLFAMNDEGKVAYRYVGDLQWELI
ncbi:MAG: DUF2309 domain-containing protein [Bacteroidota bacterium]